MKKILLAFVQLFSLASCTMGDGFYWSYVDCYLAEVSDFKLETRAIYSSSGGVFPLYGIYPIAQKELFWPARNSDTPKEDEAKFEQLCLKNGDWSYNQEYEDLSAGAIEQQNHIYVASPIVRVNFTSSQTWGREFPAGTSLNGVLMCYTATPDEYIRGGYRRNLESLREKMREVTDPLARAFWQDVLKKTRGDQTPIVGRALAKLIFANIA